MFQVEVDDDDEAIGDDGDDGYNPNEMKIKSGIAKSVHDQVITKRLKSRLKIPMQWVSDYRSFECPLYSSPKYSVVPITGHWDKSNHYVKGLLVVC